jgi:Ni,Fe-hydrogenase III component G
MLQNSVLIDKDKIEEEANNLKMYNYRFVAMTCDKEGEEYEITYHFDLNYEMKHLRIMVKPEDTIKSISPIFSAAFLIENEYQDLFGFNFSGLTVDYRGNMFLAASSPKTPLVDSKQEQKGE